MPESHARTRARHVAACVGFIVLCNGVGFASALIGGRPTLYQELRQPAFAPPPWLFGPVWTALYTLMGIAVYLVWRSPRGRPRTVALWSFGVQLALNAAWTPVFFGAGRVGAAFGVILAVWAAVLAMMLAFAGVERRSGLLVVPLLAWVSFATVLNGAIYVLNRY